MADYKKVSRGDSPFKSPAFTASWQNDVTDMLAWFRKAKASGEVLGAGGSLESSSGVVRVKNLTTADQLRGNYMQLGDYLLDDVSQHKHWYEGNLYDAAENGKVAILERAVKSDDTSMVRARILGKCTARVNVTDVNHRFAVPADGESVFDSASSGDIEILGAIDGTGEQELPVLLGGGGGGVTATTNFGRVTQSAAANFGSEGKYVPLADAMPVDVNGDELILDTLDPDYDADKVAEAELPFKSAHEFSACPAGSRIQVWMFSITGEMGTTIERRGLLTDAPRELVQREKEAAERVAAAERARFPQHHLVVRGDGPDGPVLAKGVACLQGLRKVFQRAHAADPERTLHVENDLRAHTNPTRQTVIRQAGLDLVRRFQCRCPQCQAPGFGLLRAEPGAPCASCGTPTRMPRAEVWSCPSCGHEGLKPRPQPVVADPQRCDVCNP